MTAAAGLFRTLAETARLGWADRRDFLDLTSSHLNLVLLATAIAVAIGLPLGVLASRSERMERATLAVANVFQTIPGLAMLGLLLIVFGRIGTLPALVALVLYALLPIVKNTVLGLRGIDPGVLEAARGMGMTAGQRLR